MSLIEADGLKKSFGDEQALDGVSLEIEEGEIVGVLGPNGAGKSTLMKILTGQLKRDGGDLQVLMKDPQDDPAELREDLGVLPEREDPPSFLTGREFLNFCSDVREQDFVENEWINRLNLSTHLDKFTQDLSKGERQKLMIAQAFFHRPEIVFIDEPMINLDPFVQEEAKDLFKEHRDSGNTVFMCTHVISLAEELCDRVLFMREGKIVRVVENVENLREKFLNEG